MWNAVQRNIGGFQRVFGSKNFIIVDNNEDISDGDLFAECTKRIRGLVSGKVTKTTILAPKENGGCLQIELEEEVKNNLKILEVVKRNHPAIYRSAKITKNTPQKMF